MFGVSRLRELNGRDDDRALYPIDPTTIVDRPDEWQARVCYALALLVEPVRARTIAGSLRGAESRFSAPDLQDH